MARFQKSITKSEKYKYVYLRQTDSGDLMWVAQVNNKVSYHKTEHEAAKQVDLKLIAMKKEPINVLKRV